MADDGLPSAGAWRRNEPAVESVRPNGALMDITRVWVVVGVLASLAVLGLLAFMAQSWLMGLSD